MNNEPVAWMANGKEFYVQKNYCPDFIPLYTHPAKTLTDDAKYNVTVKWDGKTTYHENVSLDTPLHYNEPKTLTDEEILRTADSIVVNDRTLENFSIDFARAILKKAREK
jgi:hypothetical protein